MSEKDTKPVVIGGHEMDERTATRVLEAVRISVPRVVEEMAINGRKDEEIKAAAITIVEAIAGAFSTVCNAVTASLPDPKLQPGTPEKNRSPRPKVLYY
jgi:hypothetical protein